MFINMSKKNCKLCGREFKDSHLFQTCEDCRLYDKPTRPRKGKRWAVRKDKSDRYSEEDYGNWDDVIRAMEENR